MKKTILFGLCLLLLVGSVYAVPAQYNLTLMGNSTGIVGLMQKVNTELMNGYFGVLLILSIWIMAVMGFMVSTAHAGKSMAAASYISFVLCVLLRILDVVSDITLYVTLAITALATAFLIGRE